MSHFICVQPIIPSPAPAGGGNIIVDGYTDGYANIGDCVYTESFNGDGYATYRKADPTDITKMPAVGLLLSAGPGNFCRVQLSGVIQGLYGGFSPRQLLFVGLDGRLSTTPPILTGGYVFIQHFGACIGENVFHLTPNYLMTKRIS